MGAVYTFISDEFESHAARIEIYYFVRGKVFAAKFVFEMPGDSLFIFLGKNTEARQRERAQ